MKPSWDDAPDSATHLAQDDNGKWHWFDCEPDYAYRLGMGEWQGPFGSMKKPAYPTGGDTLEARP